jgi:RNA polymerase sigma factor (sigma-70 family)
MSRYREPAIESVRDGKPDCRAIYVAFRSQMMNVAVHVFGSESNSTLGMSAADVVDQVVTDILTGKVKLRPEHADRLGAYLVGIVKNRARTLIRRRSAETRATTKRHLADETDVQGDVETLVLAERIKARIHRLNERERHVIIENVMNGRPAKEIAGELGCTPQYISQIRKASLRKLHPDFAFDTDESSDDEVENSTGGERKETA